MEEKQERKHHVEGCRCTYCDAESQGLFQELLQPQSPSQDLLGTIKPQVFAFEGQTKEEVEKLLKEDEARKARFWEQINKMPEVKAHFKNIEGMGDIEPELHRFVDQSLEDVKELIRKSCEQNWEYQEKVEEPCPEPNLLWPETASGDHLDIRTRFEKQFDPDSEDICDINPELIVLAGVAPTGEAVPNEPILNQMMSKLIKKGRKKYPKLDLSWFSNCWDKRLLVNGAPTRIRYQRLRQAYDGLKNVTGKQEAARIVGQLVLKKLNSLFI